MTLESRTSTDARRVRHAPNAVRDWGGRIPRANWNHWREAHAVRLQQRSDDGAAASLWTADWCRPLDTAVAVVMLLLAVLLASGDPRPTGVADFLEFRVTVKNALLVGVFVVIWRAALTFAGAYAPSRAWSLRSEFVCVSVGCAMGSLGAVFVPLMSNSGRLGLGVLPILWVGTVIATLCVRVTARMAAFVRRARSVSTRVVIAGTGRRGELLWSELRRHPLLRYELLAVSDVHSASVGTSFAGKPFIAIDDLEGFFMRTVVDEVRVALPVRSRYEEIEHILRVCERGGVHALYLADAFAPVIARARLGSSGSSPVVSMHVVHDDWRLVVKRAIDLVAASAGLAVLSLLLIAIAIAIKVTSTGPVIFSQERFGYRKRRFRMYKFRTMVADAERRLPELESLNQATGAAFKIRNDPRITSIGRFLRRTSLDELPQLWNVVIGDMSLVGPRPMAVRDVSLFDEAWLMRRFSVRPGLTCLWQIGGRSNLSFEQWMNLDLQYIDRWSLRLDAKILARTLPAVLRREGAE
jgi:exopolysaccharide biosynthesis polyprenyl glycosylphosphotransferase